MPNSRTGCFTWENLKEKTSLGNNDKIRRRKQQRKKRKKKSKFTYEIMHMKLKSKLKTEIQNAFCYSNFVSVLSGCCCWCCCCGGIRRKLVSKSVGSAHKLGWLLPSLLLLLLLNILTILRLRLTPIARPISMAITVLVGAFQVCVCVAR